jgi:hypothetical protein
VRLHQLDHPVDPLAGRGSAALARRPGQCPDLRLLGGRGFADQVQQLQRRLALDDVAAEVLAERLVAIGDVLDVVADLEDGPDEESEAGDRSRSALPRVPISVPTRQG